MKTLKTIALITTAVLLTACGTTNPFVQKNVFGQKRPMTPNDGHWIGSYTFTKGDPYCPQRGVLNIQVQGGIFFGKTTMNKFVSRWHGEIVNNVVAGETERKDTVSRAGTFEGTFSETTATGTWQSKACEGTWDLTKSQY